MPSRERPVDRARRVADHDLVRLGEDLRRARLGAGLSLRFVGQRVKRSATQVMRLERGLVPGASAHELAQIGAVVGLDVRIRAYPGPDPIRDAAQTRLLTRLAAKVDDSLTVRYEVPLPIAGDLRAWDAWISDFGGPSAVHAGLPVDAETRVHDLQALLRRLTLKLRDSESENVLLVLADTRSNRAAVLGASHLLGSMFPISPRRALAALSGGRHPGGSALVFL